jgi:hypothetical protein
MGRPADELPAAPFPEEEVPVPHQVGAHPSAKFASDASDVALLVEAEVDWSVPPVEDAEKWAVPESVAPVPDASPSALPTAAAAADALELYRPAAAPSAARSFAAAALAASRAALAQRVSLSPEQLAAALPEPPARSALRSQAIPLQWQVVALPAQPEDAPPQPVALAEPLQPAASAAAERVL